MNVRIGLATCSTLPDLDPDDQLLIEPLRALGVDPVPAVWDDPAIDWTAFDLVVVRNTWDYTGRRSDFLAWADSVPRLANPAPVIAWNTDKRYLADLAAAGVPIVPTTWLTSGATALPEGGAHVIKPAVGAGSIDAARYVLDDLDHRQGAREHVARLMSAGQTVMVQPYVESIDASGETGLIFSGGQFSHAVSKAPMLSGRRADEAGGLYLAETIAASRPSDQQLDLARRALAATPFSATDFAYARVDLVPGVDGAPILMELELTEPSLFMVHAPGSADQFAAALASLARRPR